MSVCLQNIQLLSLKTPHLCITFQNRQQLLCSHLFRLIKGTDRIASETTAASSPAMTTRHVSVLHLHSQLSCFRKAALTLMCFQLTHLINV